MYNTERVDGDSNAIGRVRLCSLYLYLSNQLTFDLDILCVYGS